MNHTVHIETATPRLLAAVRRRVQAVQVPTAFKPALDAVWAYLRAHPGLRTDGHNVFFYTHGAGPDAEMDVDFGVEVSRRFEGEGELVCVETPAGECAVTVHRGPYRGIPAAHAALHRWCAEHQRHIGGFSWEIYGDWSNDESQLETTIVYLLA